MKTFKIFKHPQPDKRIEVVKQGWSWPGFLFSWIWLLIKRMWKELAIITVIYIIINAVFIQFIGSEGDRFISLILGIVIGLYGNKYREKNLINRSYEYVDTIKCKNKDSALAAFYKKK